MDSLEIIHQVESRVGYTLPERTCDEIYKHGDNDVQCIIELYGLPILNSYQENHGTIEVVTYITIDGRFRKKIEWSCIVHGADEAAQGLADKMEGMQIEEAEAEIRKILS